VQFTISDAIKFSLESVFYIEPSQDGLTTSEIYEICTRSGFQDGEVTDALSALRRAGEIEEFLGDPKVQLCPEKYGYLLVPWYKFKNDPRNLVLLDHINKFLIDEIKKHGEQGFELSIPYVLASVMLNGSYAENDVLIGIKLLSKYKLFQIKGDTIHSPRPPNAGFVQTIFEGHNRNHEKEFHQIFAMVKQLISGRTSTGPVSSDPLKAFAEMLSKTGSSEHVSWWNILAMELKSLNSKTCSSLTVVAAAALCEGALAFFAASTTRGTLTMDKGLDPDPKNWGLASLIKAGCSGTTPLLNTQNKLRDRLTDLQDMRKVIHPSYYMSKEARGNPAVRPDQAERAVETLKQLLRAILDWVSVNEQR